MATRFQNVARRLQRLLGAVVLLGMTAACAAQNPGGLSGSQNGSAYYAQPAAPATGAVSTGNIHTLSGNLVW